MASSLVILPVMLLVALVSLTAGHYEGYPTEHVNEGRYGADYPYANYGPGYGYGYPGYGYGYYGYGFPYYGGYYGVGHNHEYDYRQFGGYPVHYGNGNFFFLGKYGGHCDAGYSYGFYFADDATSFVVCDHGRAHRMQCPKGTANRDHGYFKHNHAYSFGELCGVNTNDAAAAAKQ